MLHCAKKKIPSRFLKTDASKKLLHWVRNSVLSFFKRENGEKKSCHETPLENETS